MTEIEILKEEIDALRHDRDSYRRLLLKQVKKTEFWEKECHIVTDRLGRQAQVRKKSAILLKKPSKDNVKRLALYIEESIHDRIDDLERELNETKRRYKDEMYKKEQEIQWWTESISSLNMSTCKKCNSIRHESEFTSDGVCKPCRNEYQRNRRDENPLFKLSSNIRAMIGSHIRNGGYKKNSRTEKILGISFTGLLDHLNDNEFGFKYGDDRLDIDHIIPMSSAETHADVIALNHYTNLRLLPAEYNRWVKRNKDQDDDRLLEWIEENWVVEQN